MDAERLFTFRNAWFRASVISLVVIAVIAALIGFVWVPFSQSSKGVAGLWDAICTAAGVPEPFRAPLVPKREALRPTNVIVTADMMQPADALSIGRGATLAMQCTMCHGLRGISQADTPNLAGQYSAAIYKQLRDYKSGHRQSAIMEPLMKDLSDQDMRDLAAYYAYLPRERTTLPEKELPLPVIVANGAPMRNIVACGTCHGSIDSKAGAPKLEGEPELYIRTQLQAFASGKRNNDIHAQMRTIARQMTPEEIDEAARYYASR